jgi:uncharacterized protein YpmB
MQRNGAQNIIIIIIIIITIITVLLYFQLKRLYERKQNEES